VTDLLDEILRVFDIEIDALTRVRKSLGPAYVEAVQLIFECRGKVIVTGVGKSGLIGQKVAATMASTGTPAIFLHPADGMHGGLGVVQHGDVVVAIGKSGESDELIAILPPLRTIGARVIAITGNAESTLARHADVVLVADAGVEACPMNLAPTSSTTVALVVGDALAVALMKLRNFQPENFALYHPGGQLGKRLLLTVGDIMRRGTDNPVIRVGASTREMLVEMTSKRMGATSVVDDEGGLRGLVTDYDVRRVLEQGQDLFSMTIVEVMNPAPSYTFSDEKAVAALEQMENREKPFLLLPVLNRETRKVVGMVHLHDLFARGL
jgi:arabinose-5-phosphate isomerase